MGKMAGKGRLQSCQLTVRLFRQCRPFSLAASRERVTELSLNKRTVAIERRSGKRDEYHYFWLRDNCRCAACLHPVTNQRLVDTLDIPADIEPSSVNQAGDSLQVHWQDGHESTFTFEWLASNSYHLGAQEKSNVTEELDLPQPRIWDASIAANPPRVGYCDLLSHDRALVNWIEKIAEFGFCIVNGVPPTVEASEGLVKKIGVIRSTIYGVGVDIECGQEENYTDTAYTMDGIESHTDGCYFSDAPGLQVFHVLKFNGSGGTTTLVDGFKVAQRLQEENPEAFHILSTARIPYHHTDADFQFINYTPVFVTDPITRQVIQMRFNSHDRLPINRQTLESLAHTVEGDPAVAVHQAIRAFLTALKDKRLGFRFLLEPGSLVVTNNHRVTHARDAFTGLRRIWSCYVNREDWVSRLRGLRRHLAQEGAK